MWKWAGHASGVLPSLVHRGPSLGVHQPLLARIEATDRLIDQIVYRLYGLTDEEIVVVEGG